MSVTYRNDKNKDWVALSGVAVLTPVSRGVRPATYCRPQRLRLVLGSAQLAVMPLVVTTTLGTSTVGKKR